MAGRHGSESSNGGEQQLCKLPATVSSPARQVCLAGAPGAAAGAGAKQDSLGRPVGGGRHRHAQPAALLRDLALVPLWRRGSGGGGATPAAQMGAGRATAALRCSCGCCGWPSEANKGRATAPLLGWALTAGAALPCLPGLRKKKKKKTTQLFLPAFASAAPLASQTPAPSAHKKPCTHTFRMPRSRPSIVRTRPRARRTSSLALSRTAPLSSMAEPMAPASSGSVAMLCIYAQAG